MKVNFVVSLRNVDRAEHLHAKLVEKHLSFCCQARNSIAPGGRRELEFPLTYRPAWLLQQGQVPTICMVPQATQGGQANGVRVHVDRVCTGSQLLRVNTRRQIAAGSNVWITERPRPSSTRQLPNDSAFRNFTSSYNLVRHSSIVPRWLTPEMSPRLPRSPSTLCASCSTRSSL